MIYLLPSKKGNRGKFLPFIVVLVFVCFIFLINFFAPTFFGRVANTLGIPVWQSGGFVFTQVANTQAFFHSRKAMLDINRNLKQELMEANARLFSLSVLEQENVDLKREWSRSGDIDGILAVVLVKPPQSFYDTLILDVGEEDEIKNDASVTIGDSIILGKIDEVYGNTSRAKLFSSVDTETSAVINRNNIGVTLIGMGGGNFEIKAPQELDILEGDTIILPDINPSVVATVVAIESNPTNSFKRVFCKTPVNIAQLRWVSIIK